MAKRGSARDWAGAGRAGALGLLAVLGASGAWAQSTGAGAPGQATPAQTPPGTAPADPQAKTPGGDGGSPAKPEEQAKPAPAANPAPAADPANGGDGTAFPEAKSEAAQDAAEKASGDPGTTAFPQERSEAAQRQANADNKAAEAGPAASGEDDSSSSSRSRLKGVDLLGSGDSPSSNGAGGVVNDPELSKKDVRIGQLYMGDGDYRGAYSRFKEATQVNPGNAEAVFFLAEAARKTSHLDEAEANYRVYLEADPKGKRAKDAKKALAELAGK